MEIIEKKEVFRWEPETNPMEKEEEKDLPGRTKKEREIVNIEEISEQIKDFDEDQMEGLIKNWLDRRYDPGPGAQFLKNIAKRYDY